jgi:hypothetical protein
MMDPGVACSTYSTKPVDPLSTYIRQAGDLTGHNSYASTSATNVEKDASSKVNIGTLTDHVKGQAYVTAT